LSLAFTPLAAARFAARCLSTSRWLPRDMFCCGPGGLPVKDWLN
jgi:hypothetical protein